MIRPDTIIRLFVCQDCPGGPDRLTMIRDGLAGLECQVLATDCLSGCRSEASVAVRAAGRMAYLFGPVDSGDLAGLRCFLDLYASDPEGRIHDARPLGPLRMKALARIPAA